MWMRIFFFFRMNLANFTLPPLDRHTWLHMVHDSFEDVQLHRYSPYFSQCTLCHADNSSGRFFNYQLLYDILLISWSQDETLEATSLDLAEPQDQVEPGTISKLYSEIRKN